MWVLWCYPMLYDASRCRLCASTREHFFTMARHNDIRDSAFCIVLRFYCGLRFVVLSAFFWNGWTRFEMRLCRHAGLFMSVVTSRDEKKVSWKTHFCSLDFERPLNCNYKLLSIILHNGRQVFQKMISDLLLYKLNICISGIFFLI